MRLRVCCVSLLCFGIREALERRWRRGKICSERRSGRWASPRCEWSRMYTFCHAVPSPGPSPCIRSSRWPAWDVACWWSGGSSSKSRTTQPFCGKRRTILTLRKPDGARVS